MKETTKLNNKLNKQTEIIIGQSIKKLTKKGSTTTKTLEIIFIDYE